MLKNFNLKLLVLISFLPLASMSFDGEINTYLSPFETHESSTYTPPHRQITEPHTQTIYTYETKEALDIIKKTISTLLTKVLVQKPAHRIDSQFKALKSDLSMHTASRHHGNSFRTNLIQASLNHSSMSFKSAISLVDTQLMNQIENLEKHSLLASIRN